MGVLGKKHVVRHVVREKREEDGVCVSGKFNWAGLEKTALVARDLL